MAGRGQTTQGVWIAANDEPGAPRKTVVLDLEGTDGRERGEEDTSFERQTALFALANSDVIIINLWCHDVGREHGAGKPLLRTVLQVNLRLFGAKRRPVLCFALRDRTRTPLDRLSPILREDLHKMWEGLTKPAGLVGKGIDDVFDLRFVALPSFEMAEREFLEEVAALKQAIHAPLATGTGMAPDGTENAIPAPGLATSMSEIWSVVKANKDLDLPTHAVMVATVRCAQIAQDALDALERSRMAAELLDAALAAPVEDFGDRCNAVMDGVMADYDEDARYFDAEVRRARRAALSREVLGLLHPGFVAQMAKVVDRAIDGFDTTLKTALDDDGDTMEEAEQRSLRAAAEILGGARACVAADSEWALAEYEERVGDATRAIVKGERERRRTEMQTAAKKAVASTERQVRELFETLPHDIWESLRSLVRGVLRAQSTAIERTCTILGLSEEDCRGEVRAMEDSALDIVRSAAQLAVTSAPRRLMDSFSRVFSRDERGLSRRWRATDDVVPAMKRGKRASATTLSNLAAIRMAVGDEGAQLQDAFENIDRIIASLLNDHHQGPVAADDDSAGGDAAETSADALRDEAVFSSSRWPGVPQEIVLIAPCDSRRVWDKFEAESEVAIGNARDLIDAAKTGRNVGLPPAWAICAMAVLGFNEVSWFLKSVLLNPVALVVIVVSALLLRAIWVALDVQEAMANGVVPGLLMISARIVPALLELFAKLVEAGNKVIVKDPAQASGAGKTKKTQ